eukprot:2721416-Pyramimonas_sp.AAC.1
MAESARVVGGENLKEDFGRIASELGEELGEFGQGTPSPGVGQGSRPKSRGGGKLEARLRKLQAEKAEEAAPEREAREREREAERAREVKEAEEERTRR